MRIRRVDVFVAGSGFSGAVFVANLLRTGRPLSIAVADKSGRFFRGAAYSTTSPSHLLDVPAGKMSAFASDPEHFLRWLRTQQPDAGPGDFAERRLYGEYLSAVVDGALRSAAPGTSLELLPSEAVRATPIDAGGFSVHVQEERFLANTLVLATGNGRPPLPRGIAADLGLALAGDPWAVGALDGIQHDAPVLLLGTGLTAVDALLRLRELGHRGDVHMLSRHGLLPRAHAEAPSPAVEPPLPLPATVRGLTRMLRAHARAIGWRAAIDGMRPQTTHAWAGLDEDERRRFLRHVRPFWDAHRHRMAPDIANLVEEELAFGLLRVHAGRLVSAEPSPAGAHVTWTDRRTGGTRSLEVERVVNATGASNDLRGKCDPLIESLRDAGLLVPDFLGLGLLCDREGRVLTETAERQEDLLALGPLRRGLLWESTAVPELREQARIAAERVSDRISEQAIAEAISSATIPL